MKAVFEITVVAVALLLELVAGNAGFSIRLTAYVLFYFACADSPRNALIGAGVTGVVTDLLLHRPLPLTPLLLAATLAAGWSVRRKHRDHLLEAALPGLAIGMVNTLGDAWITHWAGRYGMPSDELLWGMIFHGAAGMLLLTTVVFLLDGIAGALDLPRFLGENQPPLKGRRWGSRPRTVKEHTVNPDRRKRP